MSFVKWSPPFKNEDDVERPTYDLIRYEKDGPVGRIVLNSPEKRNPLGYERLLQLSMAAKEMELDDDIRVIIIKGDGPSFCAGYDITPIQPGEEQRNYPKSGTYINAERDNYWMSYDHEHLRIFFMLWDLQKPVIAQIHGYCLAGGTELAAFCDVRVVSTDAQIGFPVARHGSPGNIQYMPWLVGMSKAMYYMLTCQPMDGAEAFRCGWASALVEPEELEAETERIAHQIALTDTSLAMLTKRSIHRQYEIMGFRTGMMSSAEFLALAALRPRKPGVEGGYGSDEFNERARKEGLKAALDWRDQHYDMKYRTSDQARKRREESHPSGRPA